MTDQAGTVIGGAHERSAPNAPGWVSERMAGSSGSQRSKTNWGAAQSSPITRARLAIERTLVTGQPEALRCQTRDLPGGQTDAAPLAHGLDQLEVEPVPSARTRTVEALRMPEDRERASLLGRPVEKPEHARFRLLSREPGVPLLGERRIHHCERQLDEVGGAVACEVPGTERVRDAGAEAERIREAERRVVAEADSRERREVAVRIDAEVVVALPDQRPVELRQQRALAREPLEILGGEVTAVETDLRSGPEQRLHQLRPQPLVRLGRGAVGPMAVTGQHEERRTGVVLALFGGDLREAPVGIRSSQLVERHPHQAARLVHRRACPARESVTLQPRSGAEHADPGPAPGHVDVMRERDGEPRSPVARRLGAQLPAQPFERRVEWIEAGRGGEEATVRIALRSPLLDPREVEEARRELVSMRPLAA